MFIVAHYGKHARALYFKLSLCTQCVILLSKANFAPNIVFSAFLINLKAPINFRVTNATKIPGSTDEDEEIKAAMEINDQWNAEIASAR